MAVPRASGNEPGRHGSVLPARRDVIRVLKPQKLEIPKDRRLIVLFHGRAASAARICSLSAGSVNTDFRAAARVAAAPKLVWIHPHGGGLLGRMYRRVTSERMSSVWRRQGVRQNGTARRFRGCGKQRSEVQTEVQGR